MSSPGQRRGGDVKKTSRTGSSVKKEVDSKKIKNEEALPKEKRKPGQKYATPSPGQADRVFYETLLQQNPESHMAQDWCLTYGICPPAEAEALYRRVCKRKGLKPDASAPPLSASPTKIKKPPASSRPRTSQPKNMEADTGFEPANVFEGAGTTAL